MTGASAKHGPGFAAALLVFQIAIQIAAWKCLWLEDLDLHTPLPVQTLRSILIATVIVLVAVAGSVWLGRQSRQREEKPGWLLIIPAVVPLGWMLMVALESYVMFMRDYQGYPPSAFVLKYVDRAVAGLVWCSAVAAISLRLWAVSSLAFHSHIAARFAEALSLADPSEALYGWDAKPEAIATVLNQISLVSWGLTVVFALALLWKYSHRSGAD